MKKFNKLLCYFLVLSMVLTLLPCNTNAATKKKIELSSKSITLINSNKRISLNNVPTNQYKKIKWKSTNTKVVKVQNIYSNGCTIKFVGTGSCYVTATLNKKTYKCKVVAYSKEDYNAKILKENIINTNINESKSHILYEFSVNKNFSNCTFKIEYFKNGKCIEKYQNSLSGLTPNERYAIYFKKPSIANETCEYDDYKISIVYCSYNEKYFKSNIPSCINITYNFNKIVLDEYELVLNLKNNSEDTRNVKIFLSLYNENKFVDIVEIYDNCTIYPQMTYKLTHSFYKNEENGKMKTWFNEKATEFDDIKVIITSATTK